MKRTERFGAWTCARVFCRNGRTFDDIAKESGIRFINYGLIDRILERVRLGTMSVSSTTAEVRENAREG